MTTGKSLLIQLTFQRLSNDSRLGSTCQILPVNPKNLVQESHIHRDNSSFLMYRGIQSICHRSTTTDWNDGAVVAHCSLDDLHNLLLVLWPYNDIWEPGDLALSQVDHVMNEDVTVFDYEKYVLKLPEPVLLKILRKLRLPDLIILKSACPELRDYCNLHIRLQDQEFPKHPFFQFERCAPENDIEEDENIEMMPERQNASMTYYPGNQSVYLFGGETLESNEDVPAATFNDLWRLDMRNMKWSRVIISSAPYPTPKCHASLVTWKDKLILYGGRASRQNRLDTYYSELHFFDIATSTWQYVATENARATGGHSCVVTENHMIVYGDFQVGLMADFSVMDLRTMRFTTVVLEAGGEAEERFGFPGFSPRKTKLVLIREGLLLLTGELLGDDYGISALLEYDPEASCDQAIRMKWKHIETIGRWWRPKNRHPPDAEGRRENSAALPNVEFYEIADVRNSQKIRLVSLGRLKTEYRAAISEKYEAVQTLYREFCRQLKCHLELEFQRRAGSAENSQEKNTCAIFKYQNIKCRIDECFINPLNRKTPHRFKVHIRVGTPYRNPKMPNFDDFDKWELRQSIRATVNQMHSKYYNIGRMDQLAPRVPMRNGALKRLSVYVAEIDCSVEFNDFEQLKWTAQPIQYHSPMETRDYCLIGAHHEVVMHAGVVKFNETMRRMGQTALLTPISKYADNFSNSLFG